MIRGVIFDLDGTLIRSQRVLPGVVETLIDLRRRGIPIVLLTNDSQQTPHEWAARLEHMGLRFAVNEIVTAAIVAAHVLEERFPGGKILAMGDAALFHALRARHLHLVEDGASSERADVVLLGADSHFDAHKLEVVCRHIWAGAIFYATNADRMRPVQEGFIPGTGAFVQAISFVTEVEAIVTGKPSLTAANIAIGRLGLPASEVVMVGDAPISDISMGKLAGMATVLVPNDGKTRPDPLALPMEQRPDVALANMSELVSWLERCAS